MRADIDVGLMHDTKVVALARRQQDPHVTGVTLMLYVSAVLASWREDRPCSIEESAPAWFLSPLGPVTADLIAVGMLDADGRVPTATVDRWLGPARDRRDKATSAAATRWTESRTAAALPPHSGRNAIANQPTNQPTTRADARDGKAARAADGRTLKEVLRDMGAEPTFLKEGGA